ncbi:MAG: Zn-dependent hydrolase [Proteobacteria bacterium]|nr:Zn-dependent hydrolase [Pseudomonadota bacterium]
MHAALACLAAFSLTACDAGRPPEVTVAAPETSEPRPEIYAEFTLTADLSYYTEDQRTMIALLVEAAQIMDDLFWRQAYGDDYEAWLAGIGVAETRLFADQNYGPWDRMDDNKPFIAGVGPKPLGANFYPADMSKEEFEAAYLPGKTGQYSLIRRNPAGELIVVPYHVAYATELSAAAELLRRAADYSESADFANYLKLRANALVSDEYQLSDLYWMDVKDNEIDVVIGAIETYEDALYGYRAGYEAYVLLKDLDWSARLARFATFLPELQENLPVDEEYKQESPGSDSDLNAYDVIYYAGHSNAGGKTIAINLPNDEQVQLQKGTRRLQLKNAMQAKFEKILAPIAAELIDDSQQKHVTFDAFFADVMFHEVAHGLGIKNTITGKGTVREALLDLASSMEEGKADILGLYMITELHDDGEMGEVELADYYVTFMAGIFRSVRFGASEAHGKANMVRFNYFQDAGAFVRDAESGKYKVDFDRMRSAIYSLSRELLVLQGNGDYAGALELTNTKGIVDRQLQADLDRLTVADIPVDITFNQGLAELGLDKE